MSYFMEMAEEKRVWIFELILTAVQLVLHAQWMAFKRIAHFFGQKTALIGTRLERSTT